MTSLAVEMADTSSTLGNFKKIERLRPIQLRFVTTYEVRVCRLAVRLTQSWPALFGIVVPTSVADLCKSQLCSESATEGASRIGMGGVTSMSYFHPAPKGLR